MYFMKRITIDEHIVFAAEYVRFREEGKAVYCSLRGEFLLDDESFDPPMTWHLSDVGVPTKDAYSLLAPVYYSLKAEREE